MTALNTNTTDDDEWIEECGMHCTERVRHYVYVIASSPFRINKVQKNVSMDDSQDMFFGVTQNSPL